MRPYEERARVSLVDDDCPTCYPADLGFPLREIPEKYQEIISYWQWASSTGKLLLCAQLNYWKKFRSYQERLRRYYQHRKTFPDFQDKVRDRRQRYGLKGDVCLCLDARQQSRSENLIEFQNFHLENQDRLEKELKYDREKLDALLKESATGASGLDVARDIEVFEHRVGYDELRLAKGQILLGWIEEQRVVFAAEQALPVDASVIQDKKSQAREDEPKASRGAPAPCRRKRERNAFSVLSPARSAVSKNPPRKRRSLRLSNRDGSQSAEKVTAESSAPRRSKRIPHLRGKETRHGKQSAPLRPFHSQRVSKPVRKSPTNKPFANVNAKRGPMSRLQGARKRDSAERAHSISRNPIQQSPVVMTRGGRESKIPERFASAG